MARKSAGPRTIQSVSLPMALYVRVMRAAGMRQESFSEFMREAADLRCADILGPVPADESPLDSAA